MPLRGCLSVKTPPKEIINRGFIPIMGYLRRLEMGSVKCKRTKLMLVGLGGAGKTRQVYKTCPMSPCSTITHLALRHLALQ